MALRFYVCGFRNNKKGDNIMTTKEIIKTFTKEEGIAFYNAKKTDKEIYDYLVSKGLTDSFETFLVDSRKIFEERFSKMSKEQILSSIQGAELTDEQLEQIAGGKEEDGTLTTEDKIGAGVTAGLFTAAAGSLAAA